MKLLNICMTAEVSNLIRKYRFKAIIEISLCKLCKIIIRLKVINKECYSNIKDFLFFIIIAAFDELFNTVILNIKRNHLM